MVFLSFLILTTIGINVSYAQFSRVITTGDVMLDPSHADSLFLKGDYQAATVFLDSVFEDHGTVTSAQLFNRGMLARINGESSGLEWFEKAYNAEGKYYMAALWYGVALNDEGRAPEAEKYLREAVSIDKGYYESSVELGRSLRLQGLNREAIAATKKAFGRDRTYVPAYIEMYKNYIALREDDKALEILLKGYDRFPYEVLITELIDYYDAHGKQSEILPLAEEYILKYPMGPNKEKMVSHLKRLNPNGDYDFSDEYHQLAYPSGKAFADPELVMPVGKKLRYNVRWGLIKVGTLDVDVTTGEYEGKPTFYIRYIAESSPGLPFISIQDTFYSHVDRELRHTRSFAMSYNEHGYRAIKNYDSNYDKGELEVRVWLGTGYWHIVKHPLPPNAFDATSQLWLAQQYVLEGVGGKATVELSGGFEKTLINNLGPDKQLKYGGEVYDTIKLDGIMHYSGIAGLTGDFKGWYTNDGRGIPLRAKFKIFLGYVTIDYRYTEPTDFNLPSNRITARH